MAVTTLDIAWLAGLLEGEGCFFSQARKIKSKIYPRIGIQLAMTDLDPIEKAAKIFGSKVRIAKHKTTGNKTIYSTTLYHAFRVAGWMMTVYSLMSIRRQSKIRDCLHIWETQMKQKKQVRQVSEVATNR